MEQGVALTGHNTTGPPWSVGRRTAREPGGRRVCPLASSVMLQTTTTDKRRRQTPASKTVLAH